MTEVEALSLQDRALLVGLGVLEDRRDAGEARERLRLEIEQDLELAGRDPALQVAALQGVERLADAVHLLAHHRQRDIRHALVALDQLELHAEQVCEQVRGHARGRAGAGAADQQLVLEQVFGALHRHAGQGGANRMRHFRTAEPVEFDRIELDVRHLGQRDMRHVAVDHADHGAVLRRDVVEVIGGDDAAGARHVLVHEGRIAGQQLGHLRRDQPREHVVVGGRRRRDDHPDLLAAEELLGRLAARFVCARQQQAGNGDRSARASAHAFPHAIIDCNRTSNSSALETSAATSPASHPPLHRARAAAPA